MAFERGGYADKLGNRYEGRWVVRQLLDLLNERLTQVIVEAVGDDEAGIDLWIMRPDGTRQAQQCKARNASKDSWSIADLNARGFLRFMRKQLDRSDSHEVAFVSGVPTTVFGDICQSARDSTGDSEHFHEFQIEKVGNERRKAFQKFCRCLDLDPTNISHRADAFEFLRRMHFILWDDNLASREDLLSQASVLVDGEPKLVIASLAEFVLNNLRKSITVEGVRQYLIGLGFHPRQLARDNRVGPAVERLRRQFDESIAPYLIAGELIERKETKELLANLREDGLVVLHGAAGSGKSGVLYELTRILETEGVPYLPIRLDRHEVKHNVQQFSKDLGLPESPAQCLVALAGDKPGVLILDQLDALRWTASHSSEALDVSKEIVREIITFRDMGKPVMVVLAGRTFDLEHDPEIRNWLKDSPTRKCRRVEVKSLSDEMVGSVVVKLGHDYAAMSPRQRLVLQSPQHLAMWAELVPRGMTGYFDTGVQLIKQFWDSLYCKLSKAGISAEQANGVIDAISKYMEQKGVLSAPLSLTEGYPRELDELQSNGILYVSGSQISFCHQSYLDNWIARRLLKEIHIGQGTIRAWLGGKAKQSLFCREQLRQALSLLLEESPKEFLGCIGEMLPDEGVRFHLKHLVLELIGQIEQPDVEMLDFLKKLLGDTYWTEHVIESVCLNHPSYIRWLGQSGILMSWLDSQNEKRIEQALWLVRSVASNAPDEILEILERFVDRGDEWRNRVLNNIGWEVGTESERTFNLRLKLARQGITSDYLDWSEIVRRAPSRAILLIEAVVSILMPYDLKPYWEKSDSGSRRKRLEGRPSKDALKPLAIENPEFVWDLLMPHILRLVPSISAKANIYDAFDDDDIAARPDDRSLFRGILRLVTEVGKTLARKNAKEFLARTRSIRDASSPVVQRLMLDAFSELPSEAADEALGWLMADPARFHLSSGVRESEWMPAARLIQALSPHCSAEVFGRLEDKLIHYHEPQEKELAKFYLDNWKEGFGDAFWGRAQYFLLPALYPTRQSPLTIGLIGVVNRKFAVLPQRRFLKGGSKGISGWVGSPLSNKKLEIISDKAWLNIVSNRDIPFRDNRRWKQIGNDKIAESTVQHFARDLYRIAKRFPDRFGRLGQHFPADIHPDYIAAVLEGLGQVAPNDIPEAEKSDWRPASFEVILRFVERIHLNDDRGVANGFCWLVHNRPEENWPDYIVDRLLRYATNHPDPEPGMLNVWPSAKSRNVADISVHGLLENVPNSVRGVASLAIGALLNAHPDWLPRLAPAIEQLAHDPHPVVRAGAIEACLPVLNINRGQAIEWFGMACRPDLRVAATRGGINYFNCGMESHFSILAPIILAMAYSPYLDVSQEGAEEITARWLFHGFFSDELRRCMAGTLAQRKGVAQVASQFLPEKEYSEKCQELLAPLLDDPDSEVRQETGRAFYDAKLLSVPGYDRFILKYTKTKAFADDPSVLLGVLKDYSGSLISVAEVILNICEQFGGPFRNGFRDTARGLFGATSELIPLLLRLYEQAQDHQDMNLRTRCLDAWDQLFEARIGRTRELTIAIQQ